MCALRSNHIDLSVVNLNTLAHIATGILLLLCNNIYPDFPITVLLCTLTASELVHATMNCRLFADRLSFQMAFI